MNTSTWKRLLLLAAIAFLPGTAWATTLWTPTTSLPGDVSATATAASPSAAFAGQSPLPGNPNFSAPYVWGADTFALNNPGGPVAGNTLIGQPVQIAPFSVSQGGDQPVPIWTGSTGFQYKVDNSSTSGGANDGVIGFNPSSTAGIMGWMPSTYLTDKALNEAPAFPIVAAQSAVNFGSGTNTVDIGMLGDPGGAPIRTQTGDAAAGIKAYVPGCTFEYDMGSVWLSVTNNGGGAASWTLEAREAVPSSHDIAPSTADVSLANGTLTNFDSSAWYLMQVWYNYPTNTLSAQLVDASGDNLLPASAVDVCLGTFDPDIQGYGFEVDGGLTEGASGSYSFLPSSGSTELDNFAAVPEPSSFMLAGMAIAGFAAATWRRRSKQRILATVNA